MIDDSIPRRVTAMRCLLRLPLVLFLIICFAISSVADTSVTLGTDPAKYVLRGKIVTPTGLLTGELVIEGDTITCVAITCTAPAGASVLTITDAFIFPGFVDAHNHVAYN